MRRAPRSRETACDAAATFAIRFLKDDLCSGLHTLRILQDQRGFLSLVISNGHPSSSKETVWQESSNAVTSIPGMMSKYAVTLKGTFSSRLVRSFKILIFTYDRKLLVDSVFDDSDGGSRVETVWFVPPPSFSGSVDFQVAPPDLRPSFTRRARKVVQKTVSEVHFIYVSKPVQHSRLYVAPARPWLDESLVSRHPLRRLRKRPTLSPDPQ
jgi:hypothetical protein